MRPGFPLLFLLCLPLAASGAVPRYEAAWQFAAELQRDYAKDHRQALVSRLDSERMFRRMVQPLGESALADPHAKDAWETGYWPALLKDADSLAAYETLFAEQVALIEGERVLLCAFQQPNGMFVTLSLWLDERPDGRIVVVDFRSMSQQLTATQRMRALIVFIGGIFTLGLDEEERTLATEQISAPGFQRSLTHLGGGRRDEALRELQQLPDNVKATRLWRDIRDGLALYGHAASMQNALREAAGGAPLNPSLALADARARKDHAAEIAAFGRLADVSLQSPFVRSLQAGALLDAGRPAEALALSRDVYRCNPYAALACAIAVRAAAQLQDHTEALAALRAWARLATPKAIDADLAQAEALRELRASEAYRAWLDDASAVKASPVP